MVPMSGRIIGSAASCRWENYCIRGVGYVDVVEALLPYRNATNIISANLKKMFHTSKY
jgi:hypothetical protein